MQGGAPPEILYQSAELLTQTETFELHLMESLGGLKSNETLIQFKNAQ